MPPYLLPGIFVDFAADNVDILGEKLDGKNTFYATQIAAWQKGAESNLTLENLKPSTKHSLSVPESKDTVAVKRSSPVFPGAVRKEWFDAVKMTKILSVLPKQLIWHSTCYDIKSSDKKWVDRFNQTLSQNEQIVTIPGYLPILQAPAYEFETLNTVVKRCMEIPAMVG